MRIPNPLRTINLVLNFHSIPSSDWFRNSLYTIEKIYKFISIKEIESYFYNDTNFNNCCHICFDDGDQSVYKHAFPVLQEMNIPATLFVSPKIICDESNYWFQELSYIQNYLGDTIVKERICEIFHCQYEQIKTYTTLNLFRCMKLKEIFQVINTIKKEYEIIINKKYNLTKDQLLELNDSNLITFGAHTMNHPILANETNNDSEKEIHESIEKLSELLETDIKYFAYPNGKTELDFTKREQKMLYENKIKLGLSTDAGFFNKDTNPFVIPRSGYFTDFKMEKSLYEMGKIIVLPIRDIILNMVNIEIKERYERKKIRNLGIFK